MTPRPYIDSDARALAWEALGHVRAKIVQAFRAGDTAGAAELLPAEDWARREFEALAPGSSSDTCPGFKRVNPRPCNEVSCARTVSVAPGHVTTRSSVAP
jgi:hypothetical protein